MRSPGDRAGRPGFTILEIVLALVLTGIFMSFATTVFYGMNKAWRSASAAASTASRLDAMTRALRADAWDATELSTPDARTARLTLPGQRVIVWHSKPDGGDVVRTETGANAATATRQWPVGADIQFSTAAGGDALVLHSAVARSPDDEMVLVSQHRLSARRSP